jgi:pyruvate/2-oxoglutarate dehydrogenase complex dihydrolipoamide acyltransferase (E2) component
MTEGNIATWKVKEGDSFVAGDVLLEIETDKAQMDVEAQDDGILAKIIQGDGSKAVQVGTRIAVVAEPGDEISSLEMPKEETPELKKQEPKLPEPKQGSSPIPKEERTGAATPETSEAKKNILSSEASETNIPALPFGSIPTTSEWASQGRGR